MNQTLRNFECISLGDGQAQVTPKKGEKSDLSNGLFGGRKFLEEQVLRGGEKTSPRMLPLPPQTCGFSCKFLLWRLVLCESGALFTRQPGPQR